MSKEQLKFRVDGSHVEIEWPDGCKLVVLPYDGRRGIDGLAEELVDGGTYTVPGGAETITRAGHRAIHAFVPGRAFAGENIKDDRAALGHWLDEEERLNDERRARLAQWRRALRKRGGEPQDEAAD